MPHISVIMPAYNEGSHIYDNIALTRQALVGGGLDAGIVAVDEDLLPLSLAASLGFWVMVGSVFALGAARSMTRRAASRSSRPVR